MKEFRSTLADTGDSLQSQWCAPNIDQTDTKLTAWILAGGFIHEENLPIGPQGDDLCPPRHLAEIARRASSRKVGSTHQDVDELPRVLKRLDLQVTVLIHFQLCGRN